jgi:hypothetical protein
LGAALVLVRKDAVIVIIQIKPRVNYGRRQIINILQRLLPSRLPEVALLIKASEAEDSLLNILYSTEVKCPRKFYIQQMTFIQHLVTQAFSASKARQTMEQAEYIKEDGENRPGLGHVSCYLC